MDKSSQIIEVARSLVGKSCYVWGAKGQEMNEKKNLQAWVLSMEQADSGYTKEQNVDRVMNLYQRLVLKGVNPVRAFDCSGLVYYVYNKCGIFKVRRSADSYYNRCKKKERQDLRAGDLVFRSNGSKVVHTGIYIGAGRVIHAKGRDLGIVEEPLIAYGWNLFGKPDGVYDDDVKEPATISELIPAQPAVKPADEIEPPYVETDGSVYVRTAPNKSGSILGIARNEKIPFIAVATSTGWYRVKYHGNDNAYITNNPKYVRLITK